MSNILAKIATSTELVLVLCREIHQKNVIQAQVQVLLSYYYSKKVFVDAPHERRYYSLSLCKYRTAQSWL